jgi:WD40 repeat protein
MINFKLPSFLYSLSGRRCPMDRFFSLTCVLLAALPASRAQEVIGTALPEGAIARVGSIQLRHQSPLHQLAFLPNGFLAALDTRGCLRIWDTTTGHERRNFVLPSQPAETGQYEMMRRMEMMMMMRGMGKRGFRRDYDDGPGMSPQVFSADGRQLAVAEYDKVTIHDTTTGKVIRQLTLTMPEQKEMRGRFGNREMMFSPVAFSADGKHIAAGNGLLTGAVQVFDISTGKEIHSLKMPREHAVFRLQFSPTGTQLFGMGGDQTLVWDLKTGKRIRSYQGGSPTALAMTLDGRRLATASQEGGSIHLWDDTSEQETATIAGNGRSRGYLSLAFSPDGKTLLAGGFDDKLRLFDVATAKETKQLEGHEASITAVAFSFDGKLAASGDLTGRIRLWDVVKGKETVPVEASSAVSFVSVQGQKLVLGSADGSIRHADVLTGKVLQRFKGPEGGTGAVFSDDGKIAALTGNDKEGTPHLWDVVKEKELIQLKGATESSGIVFSPEGKRLALSQGEDNVLQLWDVKTGEMQATLGRHLEAVAFSPDGRALLAQHPGGQFSVWEIATGKVRLRFHGPANQSRTLALAPDGRQLATASNEIIRLWDLTTGKVQRALAAQAGTISTLAYSRDGTRLASGSADGSVRLWDPTKNQPLQHFTGHRDTVNSLAFSVDGKVLISGSADGTALVWDLEAPPIDPSKREAVKKLEALWEALASEESEAAFTAQNALVAQGDTAVTHLRKGLSPAVVVAPEQVRKLIADLDDRRFSVREKAMQELTRLGGQAAPALKEALEAKPSSEVGKRLRQLIDALAKPAPGGEVVRQVRAIEVLEQINTAQARQLLQELAKGAAGARLTEEAKTAVDRLQSRSRAQDSR